METLLNVKTAAPGETARPGSAHNHYGLQEEFVEILTPKRKAFLTPAEMPRNEQERMTFVHQYPLAALEEDEDEDEDFDEDLDELDDADLDEEEVAEIAEADLDDEDDFDLDIEDEDEEEDDIV